MERFENTTHNEGNENNEADLQEKVSKLREEAPAEAGRLISEIEGYEDMSLHEKAIELDKIIDDLSHGESFNDNRHIAWTLMKLATTLRKKHDAEKALAEVAETEQAIGVPLRSVG